MGRLGDELRAAADRADVPAGIDVEKTVGAVRRRKAVRTAGPVALGVGALAIAGVAVAPMFGGFGFSAAESATDSAVTAEDGADEAYEGAEGLPENDLASGSMLADPYMCGVDTGAYDLVEPEFAAGIGAAISPATAQEGGALTVTTTATRAFESADMVTSTPGAIVLWEGIVVGRAVAGDAVSYGAADETSLADDAVAFTDGLTQTAEVALVNCWDGAALPAGEYTVIATQNFAETATPAAEPGDDEGPNPADEQLEEFTSVGISFTVRSAPLPLTIAGDVVDHPFDQYLG